MAVDASTEITDLTVNDHACLTYGELAELLDLTAAFIRDGLASGLKVIWLSDAAPAPGMAQLARRGVAVESALAAGQMTAAPWEGRLLSRQAFTADQAIGWLNGQRAACQQQGFPGLRVAVDMSWALQPVSGVEQLPVFEEGIAASLAGSGLSVLCQYDRERFDPVTLASVTDLHTRSVAAATYHASPLLRICRQYAPPGIRLAGELDYQAEEALALALTETIRLDDTVTINMTGLSFIDAACTRMIADAARSLATSRTVVLQCPPGITARFAMFGAADLPGVSLVTLGDQ